MPHFNTFQNHPAFSDVSFGRHHWRDYVAGGIGFKSLLPSLPCRSDRTGKSHIRSKRATRTYAFQNVAVLEYLHTERNGEPTTASS
ncbi:hypothetical protein GCM10011502_30030 [Oceanisphaera marina]|uniref:Uncharacterized protein n=1 Tax=Oceanisphaera marina TaxID=2017550 RepID=A0ABQ1J0N0_9GAMM|nr:hypothetical protein GCM10011502_30030 [Oceanisphaera marina]